MADALYDHTSKRPCWRCEQPTHWRTSHGELPYCTDCQEFDSSESAGYQWCSSMCPSCGGAGCVLPGRWVS